MDTSVMITLGFWYLPSSCLRGRKIPLSITAMVVAVGPTLQGGYYPLKKRVRGFGGSKRLTIYGHVCNW